ncbi:unnamed protein product [Prunus armeniaca]|uniref:Uncharacterized protein n=1 Tax=Prunus armeniaca TaxID=36596 RepID=A0A6J5TW88_PRUAR|nr:unnamed protein product [Prunus armeniaca]
MNIMKWEKADWDPKGSWAARVCFEWRNLCFASAAPRRSEKKRKKRRSENRAKSERARSERGRQERETKTQEQSKRDQSELGFQRQRWKIGENRRAKERLLLFIQFDLAAESREVSSSAIKMGWAKFDWSLTEKSKLDAHQPELFIGLSLTRHAFAESYMQLTLFSAARKRSSEFEFEESDPEVPPEGQKLAVSQLW